MIGRESHRDQEFSLVHMDPGPDPDLEPMVAVVVMEEPPSPYWWM